MAEDRTEARRLWAMMNRGGQMAGGASVVPPLDRYMEKDRLNRLGQEDIMRNFDMGDYYAPQGVHENVLRRAQAEYARSPSNPLGDNVLEQLPSYQGIDTGYPWLDAMRQVGVNPQPEEGPIWDAAVAEQERMREEDAASAVGGASVVAPPRMPTEKETLDRGVLGPVNERDRSFSKIHGAYYTGADFGYEQGWPERLGVPQEYIDVYMAVPDEAKQYAHDNPTDAILQQFEEKYGFPLDVSVEISM